MNNRCNIILIERTFKVNYYSILLPSDRLTLFEQFVYYHTKTHPNKLNHILAWLKMLGDRIGARMEYFRNEALLSDTVALPPYGKFRKPSYVETDPTTGVLYEQANNLRLYCMRVNESVVILFSGGIKTAIKAQNCPNVRSHFNQANHLCKSINQAFMQRIIRWNDDYSDIYYPTTIKIEP